MLPLLARDSSGKSAGGWQEQSVNKGRALKRVAKASPPPPKTSKPQVRERRPLNMPALIGRWPSMQLGGGATSCWHFDGGFFGGGEPAPTKPAGNTNPVGSR